MYKRQGVVQSYADTLDSFRRRENAAKLAAWCCHYARRTEVLKAGGSYHQAKTAGEAAEESCLAALTAVECAA